MSPDLINHLNPRIDTDLTQTKEEILANIRTAINFSNLATEQKDLDGILSAVQLGGPLGLAYIEVTELLQIRKKNRLANPVEEI